MSSNDNSEGRSIGSRRRPQQSMISRIIFGLLFVAVIWYIFIRPEPVDVPPEDQVQLLALAREQLIASAAGGDLIPLEPDDTTVRTQRPGAAFVSLTIDGQLRGCMIDQFEPHEPLFVNVLHNMQLAVGADARFPSVTPEEVDDVRIKISIVHKIKEVEFESPDQLLQKLTPFEDGVILGVDGELAAYLPSVWKLFSDPEVFLEQLCVKNGWPADRWRTLPYPAARTFQVYEFEETG